MKCLGMALVKMLSLVMFAATALADGHSESRQQSYKDMTWWDPHVADITDTDTYLRRKFRQDVTDKATGVGQKDLLRRLEGIAADGKASGESWRVTKAKMFAAEVNEQSIDVSPFDWFPAIAVWNRLSLPTWKVCKGDRAREVNAKILPADLVKEWRSGNADGTWFLIQDFDHSAPDWRVIMKLGFPGMKTRLAKYAVKGDPFYDGLAIAMDAMLKGLDRFIAQGRKNKCKIENGECRIADANRIEKEIVCLTLATEHALKTRRDGFANGCPRGNNSTIAADGIGTTVDALLAVKELVYERRELSLAELGRILAANWKGHEPLRRRVLRSTRKWGNNDAEANALGAEIIDRFADRVNGKPNARGGIFLASGHCARKYLGFGAKTGATPDGRLAGEEISKNLSPTMGADTEGATALVATLAASDVTKLPGDYPLDVMLHPSTCRGEEGLKAMRTLVEVFHRNGGSVVQFTVFSAEELRDAQAHPEKYEHLQVRVCGWNVRWNDLSRAEQEAYIRRAENILGGSQNRPCRKTPHG